MSSLQVHTIFKLDYAVGWFLVSKILENQTGHLTKGVYGQNMLPYQI